VNAPSALSKRIATRLGEMGVLDLEQYPADTVTIERTYAGHWQRSAGAWSWMLLDQNGRDLFIGSHHPASAFKLSNTWVAVNGPGGTDLYSSVEES
jgi:hypothetical protein